MNPATRHSARGRTASRDDFKIGDYGPAVEARLAEWTAGRFLSRLWAKDPTLWPAGKPSEITERLGWLDLPAGMESRTAEIKAFAEEVKAQGFTRVVLLGMGGSSLAPDVFQKTFRSLPGYPQLLVLDSTHPAAVAAVDKAIALSRTLFVVSSKSGTTIEPLSLFRYYWSRLGRAKVSAGSHWAAVTDPGTPLAALADEGERKFRRLFTSPPDVGGRFSAFSHFGLVPAALTGLDIGRLLERARSAADADGPDVPADMSPGLRLGAVLGETGRERNKLTILTSTQLQGFPDWLEQLIAESLGKDGRGILPVVDEPLAAAESYGRDRVFVAFLLETGRDPGLESHLAALDEAGQPVLRIRLADAWDIGREMFRWEVAVAAAASVLDVQPFDQPDVESAKDLARKAMAGSQLIGNEPDGRKDEEIIEADSDGLVRAVAGWLAGARPKDYVALLAFIPPGEEAIRSLRDIRRAILRKTGSATTLGFGPRYLHSTGQFHKGGPNEGLFLQIIDDPLPDISVPETDYTFGRLIHSQALGDYQALKQRGRRVLRVSLKGDVAGGLERLRRAV